MSAHAVLKLSQHSASPTHPTPTHPTPTHPTPTRTHARRHLRAVPTLAPEPAQNPAPDGIEDPSPRLLLGLAAQAFEVLEGRRNVAQLGAHFTVGVARELAAQRALLGERRAMHPIRPATLVGAGKVKVCRVLTHVAEASVVLHTDHRSHAVALRVEWVHARWRASEIFVL